MQLVRTDGGGDGIVMTKGLALSGGGARGSFQVGALDCLYNVFGYRPDVIAGTSVGSVNALALAQASTDDGKLAQLNTLLGVWHSMTGPGDFYRNQQWLVDVARTESLELGGGLSLRIEDVIFQVIFNNLIANALAATSLATLEPLEEKMRTPQMLNLANLAAGVPLRMVSVSLETGKVRYATGRGAFVEDDNCTPVASALPRVAAIAAPHDAFSAAMDEIRRLMAAIESEKASGDHDSKWRNVARLGLELDRARWRAETAFDDLAAANAALPNPIEALIDPVRGALASAAIPGIFGPYQIGQENYVDGGVREIVPVRATVQMGATEVVAIVCSTQNLPHAGWAGGQSFLVSLIGSLSGITLKEIVEDDLAGRGTDGVAVTAILPSFDVHDTAVVDMGLITIAMDYGFMRAADVMTPMSRSAREDAILLSDAIAWLRTETHRLSYLWTRPLEAGSHETLLELRFRKWLIRKLVENRIASGVALPQYAMLWFQTWEQGSSGVPIIPNPWGAFVTAAETTPAVAAYSYLPDTIVYEEKGDLAGVYVVRAGAPFRGTADTVEAAIGLALPAVLTVPRGTTAHLPVCPVAGTVLAEAAPGGRAVDTAGTWLVDGSRRYLLNAASLAALSASGPVTTTLVPTGGLARIPDGGSPFWLGGLVVADSQPSPIAAWTPTPQVEGTVTGTKLILWNRSNRTVLVSAVALTTSLDAPGAPIFTVQASVPFSITAGQVFMVDVRFAACVPGTVAGQVAIDCDDPIAPAIRVPLTSAIAPLGPHAAFDITPNPVALPVSIVGATTGQEVRITNTGSRDAGLSVSIGSETRAGQFAVSTYGMASQLNPGESTRCYVSFTPTARGAAAATLDVDMASATNVPMSTYDHRYAVPLSASACRPIVFLAGGPRPGPRPRPRRPLPPIDPRIPWQPVPLPDPELTTLDFGVAAAGVLAARSFWIRNTGDAPLAVAGVVVVNQSNFGVTNAAIFPVTLQPGTEIEVPANFLPAPVAEMASAGEFWIQSDDPLRPTAKLALVGHAAGGHLAVASELLDLGRVVQGASSTLTLTSDGSTPVHVKEVRLLYGTDFAVSSMPTTPTDLAPGAALAVTVTLIAATGGLHQDQLVVVHDANPSGRSTMQVKAVS